MGLPIVSQVRSARYLTKACGKKVVMGCDQWECLLIEKKEIELPQ